MILQLEKNEMAALVLHMSIMRKNVRKGFKSNYGSQSKEVLKSYDEVKNTVIKQLEGLEEDPGCMVFHFNILEINMLHSFLGFYMAELNKLELNKMNEIDLEQINCLGTIQEKVEECKAA